MSSILEQINQLSNQFSSLFEIEGMGGSASDVPPSTNKVKKDVKTKDGKVELVSVEDELFPKDGNKREQFRQKVIDTINGMIQGTATLEDLLQVVRQKQVKTVKEGFEGAIELLENVMSAIAKSDKSPERKQELYKKARRIKVNFNPTKNEIGAIKNKVRSEANPKKIANEGFEGAIEILEFLTKNHSDEENPVVKITDKNYKSVSGKRLGGSFNKNQIGNYLVYNKDTDSSYLVTPDNWKKSKIKKDLEAQGKFYKAIEVLEQLLEEEEIKKERKNSKQHVYKRMDDPEKGKINVRKNYNRVIHNDSKAKDPFFDYVKIKGAKYRVDKYGQILEPLGEAILGTQKILELFDRPDLLKDIDNMLGSPVQKLIKKGLSSLSSKEKEKNKKNKK